MTEHKIAVLDGVHEHTERYPVELWINKSGRVVVRSYNECGNNYTDVDLSELMDWLRSGPNRGVIDGAGITTLSAAERN